MQQQGRGVSNNHNVKGMGGEGRGGEEKHSKNVSVVVVKALKFKASYSFVWWL